MNDPLSKAKALEEAHRKPLHPRIEEAKQEFEKTFGPVKVENVIDKAEEQRTLLQNKAMYKYFDLLAEALNDAGWDMKKTLKPGIEIPWTAEMVKTHIWKSVQKVMLDKESTTELTTKEVNEVYEVVDQHLSQTTGVHVKFPKDEGKP